MSAPKNKTVQVIFPIVGHFFIPPDKVIARNYNEECEDVLKEYGSVWKISSFEENDWKSATLEIIKPPGQWHFKFNSSKRFILEKKTQNVMSLFGVKRLIAPI